MLWFLLFVIVFLRNLTLKFGQNQVSKRGYVADVVIVVVIIVVVVVVVVVVDVVVLFVVVLVHVAGVNPRNLTLKFGFNQVIDR